MSNFNTSTTIIKTIRYNRALWLDGKKGYSPSVIIAVNMSLDDFLQSGTDDAIDFLYFWKDYPKPSFYWETGTKDVRVSHKFPNSFECICNFTTLEVALPPLEETYSQYMRRTGGKLVEN
jgi:hypothetical protein